MNVTKKELVLDSFQIEQNGLFIFVSRLQKALEIKVVKGSLWLIGQQENMEDDELEYIWKELQKGLFTLMPKGNTQMKFLCNWFESNFRE